MKLHAKLQKLSQNVLFLIVVFTEKMYNLTFFYGVGMVFVYPSTDYNSKR